MAFVNLARDMLADAISGGTSYTKFNNANSYLGVGNSATAYAAAQTNLQAAGAGSALRKAMDATYPQRTANALVYRSTFSTSDANFAWNEWGLFNGAGAGDPPTGAEMLNRLASSLGTKTAAATWILEVTITITLA
jgi:hypothetical protein